MTLQASEHLSGGFVRDPDERLVVSTTAGTAGSGTAGYPSGATPLTSSSGSVAAATATATLAGAAAKTTYITGFEFTGSGATAASVVQLTVTGTISGTTPTFIVSVPAGAAVGVTPLVVEFPSPIPASAVNQAIAVTIPSLGAGNTNAAVVAHGFQA